MYLWRRRRPAARRRLTAYARRRRVDRDGASSAAAQPATKLYQGTRRVLGLLERNETSTGDPASPYLARRNTTAQWPRG